MSDSKKDMTGLMDYAKAVQASGQAAPAPAGSVMEEQKIEKVDDFESLEEYGKKNPLTEPSPADGLGAADDPFATPLPSPDTAASPDTGTSGAENDGSNAMVEDPFANTAQQDEPVPAMDFAESAPPFDSGADALASSDLPASPSESDFVSTPLEAPSSADPFAQDMGMSASASEPAAPEPLVAAPTEPPLAPEPLRPAPRLAPEAAAAKAASLSTPLAKVKQYAEAITPGKTSGPAAFPFSLLITGKLAPDEQARLLDILSRENMGIREIDLEPQLEGGKILIPRISEYAGVLIVSALRGARVRMRFGPSDTIFATEDTQDTEDTSFDNGERRAESQVADAALPAESIPITQAASLPGLERYVVLDTVLATAAIHTLAVEAEASTEYGELLEALKRELKFKAQRKGATAILSFHVQLTPLQLPSQYRILVSGSAVKPVGT